MEKIIRTSDMTNDEISNVIDSMVANMGFKIVKGSGYGDDNVRLEKEDYVLNPSDDYESTE